MTSHAVGCTCNAISRKDPTHTTTLRNAFAAEMKRRYARLKRVVVESVVTNDAFGLLSEPRTSTGLVLQAAASPDQFANKPLDQQISEFERWFQEQEAQILMGYTYGQVQQAQTPPDRNWWMWAFLAAGFVKGMRRGRAELRKAGWNVPLIPSDTPQQVLFQYQGIQGRLNYILNRSFLDLKNITAATDSELRRILAQALTEGVHPREAARRIVKAIDTIGVRRANLLARTEMIAAHHSANIAMYREAGVLRIYLLAEWLTAGDSRVCPLCQERVRRDNGMGPGIYTLDQIEFMIPVHPLCRCMAIPKDITDQINEEEG